MLQSFSFALLGGGTFSTVTVALLHCKSTECPKDYPKYLGDVGKIGYLTKVTTLLHVIFSTRCAFFGDATRPLLSNNTK